MAPGGSYHPLTFPTADVQVVETERATQESAMLAGNSGLVDVRVVYSDDFVSLTREVTVREMHEW